MEHWPAKPNVGFDFFLSPLERPLESLHEWGQAMAFGVMGTELGVSVVPVEGSGNPAAGMIQLVGSVCAVNIRATGVPGEFKLSPGVVGVRAAHRRGNVVKVKVQSRSSGRCWGSV